MSTRHRSTATTTLDSRLRELFVADAPAEAPQALRERILRATRTIHQREPRSRMLMPSIVRHSRPRLLMPVALILVLVLLAAAGFAVVGGRVDQLSVSPTTSPLMEASPLPAWVTNPSYPALTPGQRYYFDQPVHVSFSVPPGWDFWDAGTDQAHSATFAAIVNTQYTATVGFAVVSNIYRDPCHWLQGFLDPPVGPTVDDLTTALAQLPGFVIAGPIDDTVGGLPAKTLALTPTVSDRECDQANDPMLIDPPGGQYAGGTMIVRVAMVSGARVMVMSWTPLPDPADAAVDVAAILRTVSFP